VAVVGHVNEQVIQSLVLNPPMVDRDQLEDVDPLRIGCKELDADARRGRRINLDWIAEDRLST